MGEYYLLVNHKLKEFIAMKHCQLANKSWVHVPHGLLVTWIMEHSRWYNTPCQLVGDEKNEKEWDKITASYKDVEIEMLRGYNEFMKETASSSHLVEITIEEDSDNLTMVRRSVTVEDKLDSRMLRLRGVLMQAGFNLDWTGALNLFLELGLDKFEKDGLTDVEIGKLLIERLRRMQFQKKGEYLLS